MKISLGMFLVLLDALSASMSIIDNKSIFKYDRKVRENVLNALYKEISEQEIDLTLIKS